MGRSERVYRRAIREFNAAMERASVGHETPGKTDVILASQFERCQRQFRKLAIANLANPFPVIPEYFEAMQQLCGALGATLREKDPERAKALSARGSLLFDRAQELWEKVEKT